MKRRVDAKAAVSRKQVKNDDSRVRDLEKRLAEALEEKAEALKREADALDQQTATSEILRVISTSPTDLQPVFETIAENALRLCDAAVSGVLRFDGTLVHLAAYRNFSPTMRAIVPQDYPMAPTRRRLSGRAILDRTVVHVPDVLSDPDYPQEVARSTGWRSFLSVPMLREGQAIGAVTVVRTQPGPFSDRQIELLKTFADQAVIAIENVRLFNETKEALQQQTATSQILQTMSSSPSELGPVFNAIAASATRLCDGAFSAVFRLDDDVVHLSAHDSFRAAALAAFQRAYPLRLSSDNPLGRCMVERRAVHITDLEETSDFSDPAKQRGKAIGYRALIAVPMLQDDRAIGAIGVGRETPGPFTEKQIALLKTFADQAVIAIENVRLFKELDKKNAALTETLEQQTATAEILRVISSSPTDVQPVFDAIVASAQALSGAAGTSAVFLVRDDVVTVRAADGVSPAWRAQYPRAITPDTVVGRAIIERRTVHAEDLKTDPAYQTAPGRLIDVRTILGVPMLKDGEPIGVIAVWRWEVMPFSAQQIALLETFADQALIAIENVRLFKDVQKKNAALTETLEQQTATAEILRTISSSPTDVQPVFDAIAASSLRLCGARFSAVYRFDGELIHLVAHTNFNADALAVLQAALPCRPHEISHIGRAVRERTAVNLADVAGAGDAPLRSHRHLARLAGYRGFLALPMIREDQVVGCIALGREAAEPFPEQQLQLIQTFADQAVIAIENVRLFHEIEQKSRQLEAASRHKSEFLANMSHELRTPLNAIIGFSEVLTERMFGELNDKQDEYLKDIHASGQHLLSLINDILDLSKIEAGRMELELKDFDLPQAIGNAVTLVRERAGRRGIALHQAVDHRVGQIRGDERKVKQVLLNLLSNALKFTPEGGRVDVRSTVVDGMAEVSVTDTGVGIAPEDQEAVFEEFRQVGTADKKVEGTGLGLTLSRKFIELHGGKIWLQSEVGRGSTFTFTLPLTRVD